MAKDNKQAAKQNPRTRARIDLKAPPVGAGDPVKPKVAKASTKTVTVIIPRRFNLTVAPGEVHTYHPGIQEMPEDHANHWYCEHNGVQLYDPKKKEA